METKLREYGLAAEYIEKLLKGKRVKVFYGELKLDRANGALITTYSATKETKIEKL